MASQRNGTLYIGVTNDLIRRVYEHKHNILEGFTKKYSVHQLVWYETHEDIYQAIAREKAMKAWKRAWKLRVIEAMNPEWNDLYDEMVGYKTGH
jgi:putative endonuclease